MSYLFDANFLEHAEADTVQTLHANCCYVATMQIIIQYGNLINRTFPNYFKEIANAAFLERIT